MEALDVVEEIPSGKLLEDCLQDVLYEVFTDSSNTEPTDLSTSEPTNSSTPETTIGSNMVPNSKRDIRNYAGPVEFLIYKYRLCLTDDKCKYLVSLLNLTGGGVIPLEKKSRIDNNSAEGAGSLTTNGNISSEYLIINIYQMLVTTYVVIVLHM